MISGKNCRLGVATKLGKHELVLAYELISEGVAWKRVAATLNVSTWYLYKRIAQCKAEGISWIK